jgi:DNA-binding beta-propeller fold protein YncE
MLIISNVIHNETVATNFLPIGRMLEEMLLFPHSLRNVSLHSVKISISCLLVLMLISFAIYPWQGLHGQVALRQWGTKGVSGNSQFQFPFAISVDPFTGSVYVADVGNNRIQKSTNSGAFIRSWGTFCVLSTGIGCFDEDASAQLASGDGQFQYPFGVANSPSNNGHVYVADTYNQRIQEFTNLGVFVRQWGVFGTGPGVFHYPFGIATNPSNNHVYVADTYNQRIQEFTNLGVFVRQWGVFGTGPGAFHYPFGIATNPSNGHVYVIDTGNHRVQEFTNLGVFVRQWGVFGTGPGAFHYPFGIATNPSNNHVYVADTYNQRIQEFTNLGVFVRQWGVFGTGPGAFQYPSGIAINPLTASAFVVDSGNSRIQVFGL